LTESSSQLQIDNDQPHLELQANEDDEDSQLMIVEAKADIKNGDVDSIAVTTTPSPTVAASTEPVFVAVPAPPAVVVKAPRPPKLTKAERERLYKLPSAPHLIVHPSAKAKGGKFDCQLVSLSHMLDYRKDDNKECSFEVFLFAECFNEMLIRDQGFNIYKHLLTLRDEPPQQLNKRKLSSANENGNAAAPANKDELPESSESKKLKSVDSPKAAEASGAESAAPTTPADSESTEKTVVVAAAAATPAPVKPKPKTIHPDILLAFTYMDTHRSGFIHEKDLEDFLLLIGLNLTRSKVRALTKKLSIRDSLISYRSLTDAYTTAVSLATNVFYKLPADETFLKTLISFDAYMKRLTESGDSIEDVHANGLFVEIDGQAIDVMKAMSKLEISEANLIKLDVKLKESLDEIGNVNFFLLAFHEIPQNFV
jgi:Ca2+-binding EF-hand superfamily protein